MTTLTQQLCLGFALSVPSENTLGINAETLSVMAGLSPVVSVGISSFVLPAVARKWVRISYSAKMSTNAQLTKSCFLMTTANLMSNLLVPLAVMLVLDQDCLKFCNITHPTNHQSLYSR